MERVILDQLKRRIAELEEQQNNNESDKSGIQDSSTFKLEGKGPEEEQTLEKIGSMDNYRRLERDLEEKRRELITMQEENRLLRESVQAEQEARVKQYKDTMELEIRIKSFEDEAIKSQQDRYQLAYDLDRLSSSQTELYSKVKESEEILNTCVTFLEKNGLIQTSFLSEDAVLFMND